MRNLFFAAILAIAAVGQVRAIEPVSVIPWLPESTYDISQSTISISSSAVTTIAAVSGYRAVHVSNLTASTVLYYRIDGSTANIPTVGFPIPAATADHTIESNGVISLQLAVGTTTVIVPIKTIRK